MRKDIKAGFAELQSIKGYFLADKRTLKFIHDTRDDWSLHDIQMKMGTLGINKLVPDTLYHSLLCRFLSEDVRIGIHERDLGIFQKLFQDLSGFDHAKFVISKFLCTHQPDYFPIWDPGKTFIRKSENNGFHSYKELKDTIDRFKTRNNLNGLDYFLFNKLLWYCE